MLFYQFFNCLCFVYFLFYCFFLLFCFILLFLLWFFLLLFIFLCFRFLCLFFLLRFYIFFHLYLYFFINILYFLSNICNINSEININIFNLCNMDWTHHKFNVKIRCLCNIIFLMFFFPFLQSFCCKLSNYFITHIYCYFNILIIMSKR